jgi:hypothetical protein
MNILLGVLRFTFWGAGVDSLVLHFSIQLELQFIQYRTRLLYINIAITIILLHLIPPFDGLLPRASSSSELF